MRVTLRVARWGVSFLIILLLSLSLGASPTSSAQPTAMSGPDTADATLTGVVTNSFYGCPFSNLLVLADGPGEVMALAMTDLNGSFALALDIAEYNITLLYDSIAVSHFNVTIRDADHDGAADPVWRTLDLRYPLATEALLRGRVTGDVSGELRVTITGIDTCYRNTTIVAANRRYSLPVPIGSFNLSVTADGTVVHNEDALAITTSGTHWLNITIEDTTVEQITVGSAIEFFLGNWYAIVILLVAGLGLIVAYGYLTAKLNKLAERKKRYVTNEVFALIAFTVKAVYWLAALYIALNLSGYIGGFGQDAMFTYLLSWFNALLLILILVLVARVLLFLLRNFVERMKARGAAGLPPTAVLLLHVVLKYLIVGVFGFLIAITLLSALGMYDMLASGASAFFSENMGYLTLIAVLGVLGYLVTRFTRTFLVDLQKRSTKYSPHMIGTMGKMINFVIYFVFGLIIIFTLLSMAKMQEIGSTIMVIASTMLGLVVAMAATGSIGNLLSGLVLQSMKPFSNGDRVSVSGVTGDIEDISLLFTRVRTLRNELVAIPNNLILASEITNFSGSGIVAIDIDLSIGYEVPARLVFNLMKLGCRATDSVLNDPKPLPMITEFKDYAIQYRLRAYTDHPKAIPVIRSQLSESLQKIFYETGVEILSPWYHIKREDSAPDVSEVKRRYDDMAQLDVQVKEGVDYEAVAQMMGFFDNLDRDSETEPMAPAAMDPTPESSEPEDMDTEPPEAAEPPVRSDDQRDTGGHDDGKKDTADESGWAAGCAPKHEPFRPTIGGITGRKGDDSGMTLGTATPPTRPLTQQPAPATTRDADADTDADTDTDAEPDTDSDFPHLRWHRPRSHHKGPASKSDTPSDDRGKDAHPEPSNKRHKDRKTRTERKKERAQRKQKKKHRKKKRTKQKENQKPPVKPVPRARRAAASPARTGRKRGRASAATGDENDDGVAEGNGSVEITLRVRRSRLDVGGTARVHSAVYAQLLGATSIEELETEGAQERGQLIVVSTTGRRAGHIIVHTFYDRLCAPDEIVLRSSDMDRLGVRDSERVTVELHKPIGWRRRTPPKR